MSWKVRAEAASSPPDTNRNGPGKPAGVRKHGTKRAKKAPQKCADRRQKVVKKTSKKCKKSCTNASNKLHKIHEKRTFFRYILLFFRLNLEVVFGAFLACFGRAVRHALRRGPPAVHRNYEKRITYI